MNPGHKRLACVLAVAGSLDCQAAITEDREENGLVPTSIVGSVSVSAAERVVAFNEILALQARGYGAEVVDLYTASQHEVPARPDLIGPTAIIPRTTGTRAGPN